VVAIAIERAQLYEDLKDANERLKEVDKLKDEFVSVASHELRTPMTAIKSYLWMALAGKGGDLSEKQKYYLDRAYNSCDRLIKLVNDMLNISRIESGRMSFTFADVDMITLVEDTFAEVKPRADELGLNLILTKPEQALPHVIADTDKIKEVVINLIGNSLKFTPPGGNITVNFEISKDMVVTHVSDNGAGIVADDMSKLFSKFGLLEGSYTNNRNVSMGTGLGLYICKNIVEIHNGKIWAYSAGKGKGSTFSFSLPFFNEVVLKKMNEGAEGSAGLGIIHTQL
jgi:signal transduction histidine kinase